MDDEENIGILEAIEENEDRVEIKQLQILDYQVEHFKKILEILQTELGYLDVSVFGCGKSILALSVCISYKMDLLLIGPKSCINQWKAAGKKYGVNIIEAMTYNALRGAAKTGVNHEFLKRNGSDFFPTEALEKYAQKGVLIVYDECHSLKNENDTLLAAHALSKEAARLARMGYNIRIAALSATPADKKENITSLFKILGIILENKLF